MATDAGELVVSLKTDISDLKKGLTEATAGISNFSAVTVAKGILMSDAIKSFGKEVLKFGFDSLKAFGDSQEAIAGFELALKNSGQEVGRNSKDFQEYATALQKVSTFSDEAIIHTGTMLTSMGLTGTELKKTTVAAMDLAKGLKIDLTTATLLLGKAAQGETSTLARYGIVIGDNVPKAQKFEQVLNQVNQRFSGASQTALQNVNGKLENMANRFNDVQEKIGKGLLPVFEFWMDKVDKATTLIDKLMGHEEHEAQGRELTIKALQKESAELIHQAQARAVASDGVTRLTAAEQHRLELLTKSIEHEKHALKEEEKIDHKRVADVKSRTKAIERFGKEEEAERKKKEAKELADLTTKNSELLSKHQTYAGQMIALRATFNEQDTAMLQAYLSDQEQRELTDQLAKLNAAGQYNMARQLQEAAVRDAEGKAEEAEMVERKKRNAERAANFRDTLNFISTLATEKNKTMAAIGKSAAIADATINTYLAATKAYASLSGIPIVGPALGAVAAALVITAGLANVARISSVKLAQGGVVMPQSQGVQATIGEAGKPEAVIPLEDRRSEKMLGAALKAAGADKQRSSVIQFNINGTFIEGDRAKFQKMLRDAVIPEIRRYSEVSPQSSFIRRRGQA